MSEPIPVTAYKDDKNVTETFKHLDPRSENRRIRLTGIAAQHPKRGAIYTYVIVTNDGNPKRVGKTGKISEQTLDREYDRVSK